MDSLAQIAIIAFPCVLTVVGYLAHRTLEKIDLELVKSQNRLDEMSGKIEIIRESVYRSELKHDAGLKSLEIDSAQKVAIQKRLNDLDLKLSKVIPDLERLNTDTTKLSEDYGKVITVLKTVVERLKK